MARWKMEENKTERLKIAAVTLMRVVLPAPLF
jgi:hypothetical protein